MTTKKEKHTCHKIQGDTSNCSSQKKKKKAWSHWHAHQTSFTVWLLLKPDSYFVFGVLGDSSDSSHRSQVFTCSLPWWCHSLFNTPQFLSMQHTCNYTKSSKTAGLNLREIVPETSDRASNLPLQPTSPPANSNHTHSPPHKPWTQNTVKYFSHYAHYAPLSLPPSPLCSFSSFRGYSLSHQGLS